MKRGNKMKDKIYYENVEQSVYDFQKEYTKDYKGKAAYRFFGRNIGYRNSSSQIEKIARVLHSAKHGPAVQSGEVIAVISPMLPEVINAFYAIAKNGATFFPIDPRTNASRIRDFLNLAEVRQAFVLDQAVGKLDAIIDQTKLENVIVISPMDSMFKALGFLYHYDQMKKTKEYYQAVKCLGFDNPKIVEELLKQHPHKPSLSEGLVKNLQIYEKTRDIAMKNLYYTTSHKKGYVPFQKILATGRMTPDFESIYDPSVPVSLTCTSGTTAGGPKLVPTKHRSYNVKVRDYAYTTMPIEVGDRILSMPPFILYGEIFMHMAYTRGVQNVIIPDITQYHYPDVIYKEKISHAVGVPSQALTLAEDERFLTNPPKHLKSVSVGGNKMLPEHERRINAALEPLGIQVTQGYSMSELTPASMTTMPGTIREGSVGKPIGDTKSIIVDMKTMEILGPNQVGRQCIKSETQFEGYYKNPEKTKETLITIDGEVYVNTGDRAYYDEDGFYYIQGRDKEIIIRPDGHNNVPSDMEELIVEHPAVEDCAVVGFPYPNFESPTGEYPKAHVVLKEAYKGQEEMVEEQLKKYCLEHFPERDVPYYYEFHEALPLTPVLKPDKLKLRQMDKEQAAGKKLVK